MKPSRSGSLILIPVAIFWCSITGVFDYLLLKSLANNLVAFGYQTGQANVTESRLEKKRDSDGDLVYVPHISYKFTAQGREWNSSQISYSLNFNSNSKRLAKEFQAGAVVPVYFSPSKPEESVLLRGEFGLELGFLMFLTPFNVIGLALVLGALGQFRVFGSALADDEIKWIENASEIRVRLHHGKPFVAMIVSLVLATFLGTFLLLAMSWLFGVSNGLSLAGWLGVFFYIVNNYLQVSRDNANGKGDLVLRNGVIEFWPMPLDLAISRSLDQITDLVLESEERKDSDGDKQTWWVMSLVDSHGQGYRLQEWTTEEPAQLIYRKLWGQLNLKPKVSRITPHTDPLEEEDWSLVN
jgi:hypothetical protein